MEHDQAHPTLLANEIAKRIQRKIQEGAYPQDSRLTVRRLCEEYGASETPVKQALNQLLTTGLVIATPHCGMRVATFHAEDMRENLEARLMVELYCAESAAARARVDTAFAACMHRQLERTNREYEACALDYRRDRFHELHVNDRSLHMQIVECCENEQIQSIYRRLNAHAMMFVGYDFHTPRTMRNVIAQHTRIVDALLQGDAVALRAAIREHIESTIAIYAGARD